MEKYGRFFLPITPKLHWQIRKKIGEKLHTSVIASKVTFFLLEADEFVGNVCQTYRLIIYTYAKNRQDS